MSGLVDTSVFTGAWPFRWLDHASLAELKVHLAGHGVAEAWIAPFEGIFYQDPMTANEALAEALLDDPFFIQMGVIDVSLPSWRRDAEACLDRVGCKALKLFPNYHRYSLADSAASELAQLAAKANVPICIQMRMQDERGQHPLVKVPGVDAKALVEFAKLHEHTRFLACAGYMSDLKVLREATNVWAEPSFVESGNALRSALEVFSPERLVFGSHSPFYYFGAAAAKVDADPADVAPATLAAIRSGNVRSLRGVAG